MLWQYHSFTWTSPLVTFWPVTGLRAPQWCLLSLSPLPSWQGKEDGHAVCKHDHILINQFVVTSYYCNNVVLNNVSRSHYITWLRFCASGSTFGSPCHRLGFKPHRRRGEKIVVPSWKVGTTRVPFVRPFQTLNTTTEKPYIFFSFKKTRNY